MSKTQEEIEKMNYIKKILVESLSKRGLEFRSDSFLYDDYINGSDVYSLDYIVNKMCQMKYLYEYCHYKKLFNEEKFINNRRRDYSNFEEYGKFDKTKVKQDALNIYSNGAYPLVYPWEKINKINKNDDI